MNVTCGNFVCSLKAVYKQVCIIFDTDCVCLYKYNGTDCHSDIVYDDVNCPYWVCHSTPTPTPPTPGPPPPPTSPLMVYIILAVAAVLLLVTALAAGLGYRLVVERRRLQIANPAFNILVNEDEEEAVDNGGTANGEQQPAAVDGVNGEVNIDENQGSKQIKF